MLPQRVEFSNHLFTLNKCFENSTLWGNILASDTVPVLGNIMFLGFIVLLSSIACDYKQGLLQ